MRDILAFDGASLLAAYRSRTLSPIEVITAVLAAIERFNPAVNAFCIVDAEAALAAARLSERRWAEGKPLGLADGLPFTVKDNMIWAGHPLRRGSTATAATPASENAPAVAHLLASGAIPVGKTTLPEFGWKGLSDSPLTGLTRNPWDTRMTTGGSSAGAAAAAALNLGIFHLGTDGAGSIRIPAGFTGIYGLKPNFGRVPAYPPSPFAIVSHIGPLTRTVRDAALMLSIMAAPDHRDITAMNTDPPDFGIGLEDGVRGLRVAWSPRLGYVRDLDPEIEASTSAAAKAFEAMGAMVEEADPEFEDPLDTLNSLWHTGAWSVVRAIPEDRWGELDPGLLSVAQKGRHVSGADFVAGANGRGALFSAMARFHERYDLLLTPTLSVPAFAVGHDVPPGGPFADDWLRWTPYSYPFNLTLQPAASVPCGLTRAGLPIGLQIVGPMRRDDLVLRASRAFEAFHPWPTLTEPRVMH
jgi:aspartyl-tRNA(Asn)/glutamyl-tRNA(Gln) amidotransferase subunit A